MSNTRKARGVGLDMERPKKLVKPFVADWYEEFKMGEQARQNNALRIEKEEREKIEREIEAEKAYRDFIGVEEEDEDSMAGTTYTPKRGRPTKEVSEAKNAMWDMFMRGVDQTLMERIKDQADVASSKLMEELHQIEERIKLHKNVTVTTDRGTSTVEGLTHDNFEALLKVISTGFPAMLVGPAGSGKTHASKQVADALGLDFFAISVGSQSSKVDLLGYQSATGDYVATAFRRAYQHGGVFVCDEIDAGNANVLIVLNSALSSGFCSFPDGMIERHEDFRFVGTANTYGTGASRQYVGRNQLDAATLDRFITVDWPVDENLEAALVQDYPQGGKWHAVVKAVRKQVEDRGYRVVVSPRATLKGAALLSQDFEFNDVVHMTLLPTAAADQKDTIVREATKAWGK